MIPSSKKFSLAMKEDDGMNYQIDYQMEHPLEWREDYVVSLANEQVQLSVLSSAACRVGSRFDDLVTQSPISLSISYLQA